MEAEIPRKRQSKWLLLLTMALAAGLLYLALRKVDWNELVMTLRGANPALLAVGFCIFSLSCLARGLRWRVLLSAQKTLPLGVVFWSMMTGYLGNSYLPARAGEVIRSLMVGQRGGISKSFALATALTERVADAVLLVAVSSAALATMKGLPDELTRALSGMALVGAVGAVAVFVAPRLGWLADRVISRLPLKPPAREKLAGISTSFLEGAGALQHWGRLALFLLFSILLWSLDTLTGLMVAQAFGLSMNPPQIFVLLAALGIASAIPSTPGYVGVYQFVAVTVLVPFGLSESQALAYIIGFQGLMYAGITLWGLLGLWRVGWPFRKE